MISIWLVFEKARKTVYKKVWVIRLAVSLMVSVRRIRTRRPFCRHFMFTAVQQKVLFLCPLLWVLSITQSNDYFIQSFFDFIWKLLIGLLIIEKLL